MQETLTTQRTLSHLSCDECNGAVIESSGNLVCKECGLIADRVIKSNVPISKKIQRWTFFSGSVNDLPIGSFITPSLHENRYWRMELVNRKEIKHYTEIFRMCSVLELNEKITLRAMNIFREIYKTNIPYQTTILIAVSIIQSAREDYYPLEHVEILTTFKTMGKKISRSKYNRCIMELNIKLPTYRPDDYVPIYLSKLDKKFKNYSRPLMLNELLDLYPAYFENSRPTSFAMCCIVISYSITYGLSRFSLIKIFQAKPSAYSYALFNPILSCYNKVHETYHSFS